MSNSNSLIALPARMRVVNRLLTAGVAFGAEGCVDGCGELVSKVAPFVFIIGFAVLVAIGIHELLSPDLSPSKETLRPKTITIDGKPEQIALTIGQMPKTSNYLQ